MPLITLDNISLRFSEKVILDEINATILKGDKIGLIGRNGEGKSSFLKVLAGLIHADDGNLKVKNNTRISYLEQQPPEDNDYSLFNIVARGLGETGKLLADYHDSLQLGNIEKSAQLQNEIESKDLWHYLHQIETILNRFKLEPKAKLSTLSGGWKRRVMLAKAIVQEPELLLLDEPTNYLDLEGSMWLENFLAKYKSTVLIISHDRALLNRAVSGILHLSHNKLNYYCTPYRCRVFFILRLTYKCTVIFITSFLRKE